MKYLFINSVAGRGSTGQIIVKACRELRQQGHECRIAYGLSAADCGDIPTMTIGTPLDYTVHAAMQRVLDCGGFGSRRATERFLRQVRAYDPDVIWLHNLHGYYIHVGLLFDYLRGCGKKIIWTLHDCWAFTGHCPYFDFAGCEKWRTGCGGCPQKRLYPESLLLDGSKRNFRKKKALFTGIPNLTIQVPSNWLADRVCQSFLSEYPIEVVYNTVDREIFKPTSGELRRRWGLEDKYIILGVASVWEPRKGLKDFIALSKLLEEPCRIVLIGLTPEQSRDLPANILPLPRTATVTELVQAYTTADVYVTPSVEETFGMTVLEAACCGTTPIVYQGTACEEVARLYGGIAVPRGAEHIADAIERLRKETT